MNNNCDYIVKEGFSPKKLNTYNKNDGEGLFLLFMIILNIYFITSGNFKNNIGPILLLCIIISFYVINKRIRLLYIFRL